MPNYPLVNFHFSVSWGGTNIAFTEVTGLEMQLQVIEYRDGTSPDFANRKMPGLRKFTNIVLKRGAYKGDNDFYKWISTAQLNTIERRDITITLLNEKHEPTIVWRVKNAWPCRVAYYQLQSEKGEVLMEELELAHEGMVVENN